MGHRIKPITFKSRFEGYQYTIKTEYITPNIDKLNFKWILVIDGITDDNGVTIGSVYSEITDGKVDTMIYNLRNLMEKKHINGFSAQLLKEIRMLKEKHYFDENL
ncbi:hypothetical protein [Virgibacillus sp. SK37]|uniref:hypothetical protein n=1 Tax=Virgibacillus sp. SK37 TaxID=403957 RepID=UPI0004D0D734|nr:hypothetical protein [Virgibacillus sp. SK37]AIF45566.1 hypothetical protein X953_16430 [Virgibacillus sp. SK37]